MINELSWAADNNAAAMTDDFSLCISTLLNGVTRSHVKNAFRACKINRESPLLVFEMLACAFIVCG